MANSREVTSWLEFRGWTFTDMTEASEDRDEVNAEYLWLCNQRAASGPGHARELRKIGDVRRVWSAL